ncbi:ribonuclease P protein component [Solirhodobacter olei]|uniref:ribonuclease P protein component n=1 Tax=Solirhodobacter olei TaxID=2493082 RepID=UPI000FDA3271|nr:ribonuclease P protein component [Solirhodobacter olei]
MTPPEGPVAGEDAEAAGCLAAVSCVSVLAKRADFLRAARARRQGTPGFLLQARLREAGEPADGIRIGFTCSKKIGNAVTRNRAKRRLREIARMVIPAHGREGWDYVLVGRPAATVERPFDVLLADLENALSRVHAQRHKEAGP